MRRRGGRHVLGDTGLGRGRPARSPCSGTSAKLPIGCQSMLVSHRQAPNRVEQGRKRFDRIDFRGQVAVRAWCAAVRDRLLRPGQVHLLDAGVVRGGHHVGGLRAVAVVGAAEDRDARAPASATAAATPAASSGPGLTASIPPEASRFAANVVRMLCSASGPSGSSSTCGRAPRARQVGVGAVAQRLEPGGVARAPPAGESALRQGRFRQVRELVDSGDRVSCGVRCRRRDGPPPRRSAR